MTTLAAKLRVPQGGRAGVLNAPSEHRGSIAPDAAEDRELDFLLLFVRNAEELRRFGAGAARSIKSGGVFWVAYPKGGKTKGATDLPATPWWHRRDVLGEYTGVAGYGPIAQVSIDDHWTALRFRPAS